MFWITALMKILNKKYLEAYSELRQTSKMERFAKIVNRFYQLNIPGIRSILDVDRVLNTPLTSVLSFVLSRI